LTDATLNDALSAVETADVAAAAGDQMHWNALYLKHKR
jgi:hypothetical protein